MANKAKSIQETDPQAILAEALLRAYQGEANIGSTIIEEMEARGQKRLVRASQLPIEGTIRTKVRIWPLHPDELNERWREQEKQKARIVANGGKPEAFIWSNNEHFKPGSWGYRKALKEHLAEKARIDAESAALRTNVEALGIVFGEEVDDRFVEVALPPGWHLDPTDHAMHSTLFDGKGVECADVFYKAAPYDRKAHVQWYPRYYQRRWNGSHPDPELPYPQESETQTHVVIDRATNQVLFATAPFPYWWMQRDTASKDDAHNQMEADNEAYQKAGAWLREHFPQASDPFVYWNRGSWAMRDSPLGNP